MTSRRTVALLASTSPSVAWNERTVTKGTNRSYPSHVERFWALIDPSDGECWDWAGRRTGDGYGLFAVGSTQLGAHRWSYSLMRAEIPDGLDLDHLCRRPRCVNPWHLEPVPRAENVRRARASDVCRKGHSLADAILRDRGDRIERRCRTCNREVQRNHMRRVRAERGAV